VGWAKREELPGSRSNYYSSFLEYNSVDGGNKRRALRIMFELVAAALGGASKFASPDLRLGSSRRAPCVAPRTKYTGSNGRGGGFGEDNGFLALVVEYRPFFAGFVSVREEPVYPGTDRNSEITGEK
jgi:hypothetical protein